MVSLKEQFAKKKLQKKLKQASFEELFSLGYSYLRENKFDESINIFTRAIQVNSNSFASYNNRGGCYFQLKKYDFALADFNKAIELSPNYVDAYINRSSCYSTQGSYEMALADYSKIIQLNPDDAESYKQRGLCYILQDKHDLALDDLNKAIQLNFNLVDYMFYKSRGLCYSKLKKYESALDDFNKAIELEPYSVGGYVNRGIHYLDFKIYDLALKDFNEAIRLNCNEAAGYLNRGLCYFKLTNDDLYKIALQDYNKATKLNPNIFESYYNIGLCYLKIREYKKSLEYFDKAIVLNPNDYESYHDRGLCHFQLKNYDFALTDFKKTIALKSDYFETYNDIGNCYYQLKEYNAALENYNKTIKLTPNYAKAYHNCAFYYAKQENYELAINNLINAIKFYESKNSKKHCSLFISDIFVILKKYDDARKYVEQAFNYDLNDTEEIKFKAVYLKNINQTEELDKKNVLLEEKNKQLELEIQEKEKAYKIAHEKEKEMLSFFTHTLRNAFATAPESLRQAIRVFGSADYEKNQKHYEAINEITALFSTFTLTDCLIDTLKQSIYDTEEFKRAWQQDNTGDATPEWFIAAALRQSLNRIIFMEDATGLRKLINNQGELIKPTRKAFIEQVLPLDTNQRDVEKFYHWLQSMTVLEVNLEKSAVQFGSNQIKFSLMFAISSELILNALKYWSGTGKIQIAWHIETEFYIFSVKNACKANASSQLAGTHKGLAFINRLIELLGEQAQFNYTANEHTFTAELKLHKTLLEGE